MISKKRRRGLALIEVLICASIAAMMLLATSIAFRASVLAYRDNTDRNLLISSGRSAMRQLIAEIRQGDSALPVAAADVTAFKAGSIIEGNGISIQKQQPDGDDPAIVAGSSNSYVTLTWTYDAATKQITRTRYCPATGTTSAVVAQYVSDFKVRMEPTRSAANAAAGNLNFDLLLRAVVTMVMQNVDVNGKMMNTQGSGLVTERLIDAAVPRKTFSGL